MKKLGLLLLFAMAVSPFAGCGLDSDGDGEPDFSDKCPLDPNKIEPGQCGCGVAEGTCTSEDTDADGIPNDEDGCPNDANKIDPGECGCNQSDDDSDGDNTVDCVDNCPHDANKVQPGACGCGVAEGTCSDSDSDGDGTPDVNDGCPDDPNKIEAGECGCGQSDKDSDGDNTVDCKDDCPNDPNKIEAGECGCGQSDKDSDGDNTADCKDECPNDPNKIKPGECGCGEEEGTCNNPDQARWTFLVFINGDNNLESLVTHDLNELEQAGSGDGVHVVVQADRIRGYVTDDGDWTNTRRYYITKDSSKKVTSQIVEDLPELDMGDPQVLADFLMWAHKNYPAKHMALFLWNHGDSWRSQPSPSQRTISDDETSGNSISIARGELKQALEGIVAARGPLDLIGFDACLMASWEVAHSLQGYALNMAASEAVVYDEGYLYANAIQMLRNNADADGRALADMMARDSVQKGGESTHSAIDLTALNDLTQAVDALADTVLDNNNLGDDLLKARNQSRGADSGYKNWYLDLNDLGAVLARSSNQQFKNAGQAIQAGINKAVSGAYGNSPYAWTGGLTIMFDVEYDPSYLNLYAKGTWAQETDWGALLTWLANN